MLRLKHVSPLLLVCVAWGCGKNSKETKNPLDYFSLAWGTAPSLSDTCELSVPGTATFTSYSEKSTTVKPPLYKKTETSTDHKSTYVSATGTILRDDKATLCEGAVTASDTGLSCTINSFPKALENNDWEDLKQIDLSWTVVGEAPAVTKTVTGAVTLTAGKIEKLTAITSGATLTADTVSGDGKQVDCSLTGSCLPGSKGSLAMGGGFACAVKNDKTVACWGSNNLGQLGVGISGVGKKLTDPQSTTPLVVPDLANVKQVVAGSNHSCALREDGSVACWGSNFSGQLGMVTTDTYGNLATVIAGLGGVVSLSAGENHTCALISDGTVKCWGSNSYKQVIYSDVTKFSTPQAVSGITGATAIAAGGMHTCALISDGTVKCWGRNRLGQLGDGTAFGYDYRSTPDTETYKDVTAVIGVTKAVAISAGDEHTCALLQDGTMKCWGAATSAQLGSHVATTTCPYKTDAQPAGMTTNCEATPVTVEGVSGVVALSAKNYQTCVLKEDSSAWCFGTSSNTWGQIPAEIITRNAVALSVGASGGCALLEGGQINCWGGNTYGQLGNGTMTVVPPMTPTPYAANDSITPVLVGTTAAPFTAQVKSCRAYTVSF